MNIFPAIDLRNGQCVRLTQGDFAQTKIYEDDPVLQAQRFAGAGAEWLHIVDLDGARDGACRQSEVIERIARSVPLKLQVGGGIRDDAVVESFLNCGIERVVIGSLAVQDPERVRTWLERFGGARIVAAFDVRLDFLGEARVLTEAWRQESARNLWDMLDAYAWDGLTTVLCTDVARDGMFAGPNLVLYQAIQTRWPELELLASGGVRNVDDLHALAELGVAARSSARRFMKAASISPTRSSRWNMLAKRIIPCLDIKDGEVVKGVKFRNHEVVGDIVDLAQRYRDEGADELVLYDITASSDGRIVDRALDRAR